MCSRTPHPFSYISALDNEMEYCISYKSFSFLCVNIKVDIVMIEHVSRTGDRSLSCRLIHFFWNIWYYVLPIPVSRCNCMTPACLLSRAARTTSLSSLPSFWICWLLIADYWLLITDCWLLITDDLLLIADDWLLIADYWLLMTDYWLLMTDYWLLIIDCWLLIADYWLLMTDDWLLIIDCWLLIADYLPILRLVVETMALRSLWMRTRSVFIESNCASFR